MEGNVSNNNNNNNNNNDDDKWLNNYNRKSMNNSKDCNQWENEDKIVMNGEKLCKMFAKKEAWRSVGKEGEGHKNNIIMTVKNSLRGVLKKKKRNSVCGNKNIIIFVMSWKMMVNVAIILIFIILSLLIAGSNALTTNSMIDYDCDPCVSRPDYTIRAILPGSLQSSPFWRQVHASMAQAAADMKVTLQFEFVQDQVGNSRDDATAIHQRMAQRIIETASSPLRLDNNDDNNDNDDDNRPADAIIVTIPDMVVQNAIQTAIDEYQMPVFGFHVGHEVAKQLGVLGYVAQDDFKAGYDAAMQMLQYTTTTTTTTTTAKNDNDNGDGDDDSMLLLSAVFVNPDPQDSAIALRRDGFEAALLEYAQHDNNNNVAIQFKQLIVDSSNPTQHKQSIDSLFQNNCPNDLILFGADDGSIPLALQAFQLNACLIPPRIATPQNDPDMDIDMDIDMDAENQFNQTQSNMGGTNTTTTTTTSTTLNLRQSPSSFTSFAPTVMATFDETEAAIRGILEGKLVFAIDQQVHIQAAMPVILATLYVTTGQTLALPVEQEHYLSGPVFVKRDNAPSDSFLSCFRTAFPTCEYEDDIFANIIAKDSIDGDPTKCKCKDRSTITIGGVVHGPTTDTFWDPVFESANQAASDMGIQLDMRRFQPQATNELIHEQMSARIRTLCQSGAVDALFVTIPSETVVESIKLCQTLNVPIVSINSGADLSKQLGLRNHIGMVEYSAGYGAGERLVQAGMKYGFCLNHAYGNVALFERCQGLQDAITDSNDSSIQYVGNFEVPADQRAQYKIVVQQYVADYASNNDWDGIGLLALGSVQVPALQELLVDHPNAIAGSFDTSEDISNSLRDGVLLFGIDQQPFLQGNMPIYLLTYLAYTRQYLINQNIETGPSFILSQPSPEKQICEANFYEICPDRPPEDFTYIGTGLISMGYSLVASMFVACGIAAVWTWVFQQKWIVKVSQPLFLYLVIIGCIISTSSILFLGVETTYRYEQEPATGVLLFDVQNPDIGKTDAACMAVPWLHGVGFVITFSALFAKIQRVKLLYQAGLQMRRKTVGVRDVAGIMAFLLFLEITILIIWQIVSPFRWEREVTEMLDEFPIVSVGRCESSLGNQFFLGLTLFNVVCLIYALILCFQTKDIHSDFAESSFISLAVLFMFQVLVLTIPIVALVQDDTDVLYFVLSCAIFSQNFTVIGLVFGPKMFRLYKDNETIGLQTSHTRGSIVNLSNNRRPGAEQHYRASLNNNNNNNYNGNNTNSNIDFQDNTHNSRFLSGSFGPPSPRPSTGTLSRSQVLMNSQDIESNSHAATAVNDDSTKNETCSIKHNENDNEDDDSNNDNNNTKQGKGKEFKGDDDGGGGDYSSDRFDGNDINVNNKSSSSSSKNNDNDGETYLTPREIEANWQKYGFTSQEHVQLILELLSKDTKPAVRNAICASCLVQDQQSDG